MPKEIKNKSGLVIKSKESDVAFWLSMIDWGMKFREKRFTKNAKRWKEYFKGSHWPDENALSKDDRLTINYCYAITKSIIPQIYYQDPYFYLTAIEKKYQKAQQMGEDVLNNYWSELKVKSQIRRIVQDFLILSFGMTKQGYQTKFVQNFNEPNALTGMEFTEYVEEENPWLIRVSPNDIIFDPEAKHFDERRWDAIHYFLPVIEAKRDFKNIPDEINEEGISRISKEYSDVITKFSDTDIERLKKISVWEINDRTENRIITVSEGVDDFLKNIENVYDFDLTTIYSPNDIPDELYPISEISQICDLNWELDQVRTQMMLHRRKMQRKILAEESAFTNQAEKKKFLSGEDMQMVVLADGAIKERKVMVIDASSLNASFFSYGSQIVYDINDISAVGANQRANEDQTTKTATEASIIDKNAGLRNSERLDYMADYTCDIAKKLFKILQKFGKPGEFYSEKREEWVKWAKENIAGNFKVKIHVGSTARRSEEQERAMLIQMIPNLLGITDLNGNPACNQPELFRYLFSKYGMTEDEIKRILVLSPQQQPQPPKPPKTQMPNEEIIQQLLGLSGGGSPYGQEAMLNPQAVPVQAINQGGMML